MSATFELIEPAGATLSTFRYGSVRSVSWPSMCGVATFGCAASERTLVLLPVIPSGTKIRSCTSASQLVPAAAAAAWPAAMYMRFE